MADFNNISPATLVNWNAVTGLPVANTDAGDLYKVDHQTRKFVYDYLATKFNSSTEKLLPGALDDTSLDGKVKGATGNAGTQRGILLGSVSTPDLRDAAVSNVKIAAQAVTTDKIALLGVKAENVDNGAISPIKLADAAVTTDKLEAGAVTSPKLGLNAVQTNNLADGSVTNPKIADGVVDSNKIFVATNVGDILLADNAKKFRSVKMSGAATINESGALSLKAGGKVAVAERVLAGGDCGASLAGANIRGTTTPWVVYIAPTPEFQGNLILVGGGSGKIQLNAGRYMIRCIVPSYAAGKHYADIVQYSGAAVFIASAPGTSAKSPANTTTNSHAMGVFTFSNGDYLRIEHNIENAVGSNGLGIGASGGGNYFTIVEIESF